MDTQETIAGLRLTVASPQQMRSWSCGEVTSPQTLHYLSGQPVPGGLFCERIFGPTRDWHCSCGTYRREQEPGFCCEECGVEITRRTVRRERMGYIELAAPIAHPWYARATPNVITQLLDCSPSRLKAVLSYSASMVISVDEEQRQMALLQVDPHDETEQRLASVLSRLAPLDLLEEPTARALSMLYGQVFRAGTGAGAVRELLLTLDLDALSTELRQAIRQDTPRRRHAIRRLHLVEALRRSGVHPAHMILDVLPVLPPDLRPLVELEGVRLATSDVNTLYERILCRNERIKHFRTLGAPTIMLNYEQRLLQDACNALFVGKHTVTGSKKQPLKSLTAALSGKGGRFRHNLLGKRVDYSGRSVIVGDATLQLQQCGLPTSICLELFKPFLMRRLLSRHLAPTARAAKRMVERAGKHDLLFWDILEEVMYEKVVLLNRAPTLHRLSIQAFEPLRVEGSAIRLHPLVCSAFNADFDGDQMAVHLPLSDAAQREARTRLLSTRNLRSPASGEPSISIAQEMVLGLFYLTQVRPGTKRANRVFADVDEVMLVLEAGVIDLHTPLVVRVPDQHISESPGSSAPPPLRRRIETTAGRLIFNEALPEQLRYKNYEMTKERIKQLVTECLRVLGEPTTAQMADALKTLGFHYATKSGISFAISDIEVPAEKADILAQAEAEVEAIEELHQAGMIDTSERSRQRIDLWTKATEEVSQHLEGRLDPWGSLATIIKSGATKAKFQQIRQLSGIRGLMARPSGEIIDIPIRGNYLEGLTVREAFIAASAARNGFMGRSLNTQVTGYLTRKLVEVGMEVSVTMEDCGTPDGLLVTAEHSQAAGGLRNQFVGRVLAEPASGLLAGVLLGETEADHLIACGVHTARVRSVLTCRSPHGVCRRCYGSDLSTGTLVQRGAAVGVVAGQSIGEPGTQLSMRAFHSGGVAFAQGDIRAGLPRVIDLFEAHPPAHPAILARHQGRVTIRKEVCGETTITIVDEAGEMWSTRLPAGQKPAISDGQSVVIGTPLSGGTVNPHELLSLLGSLATARYLVAEVQQVFRGTGVYIADKHIECIARQMLRFVVVGDEGDTSLLPGAVVERSAFEQAVAETLAEGGHPATASPLLFGLTRAALHTTSWIAAASFQETSRVLTRAAIGGQCDDVQGFKSRLVIGRRIPECR